MLSSCLSIWSGLFGPGLSSGCFRGVCIVGEWGSFIFLFQWRVFIFQVRVQRTGLFRIFLGWSGDYGLFPRFILVVWLCECLFRHVRVRLCRLRRRKREGCFVLVFTGEIQCICRSKRGWWLNLEVPQWLCGISLVQEWFPGWSGWILVVATILCLECSFGW